MDTMSVELMFWSSKKTNNFVSFHYRNITEILQSR